VPAPQLRDDRHRDPIAHPFMTGTRASTSVLALAACLVLPSALLMQHAHAEDAPSAGRMPTDSIHFELPAQPLAEALRVYGRITEELVIVQTRLVEGRTSAPVKGEYPPHEALRRLLAGTGLQASVSSADEIVIVPRPETSPPSAPTRTLAINAAVIDGVMAGGDNRSYAALLQTRLTQALCASPATRPGSYRLVAQLRIDNSGLVVASRIVESTGRAERDAAIEQAMSALVLDSAPPATLQEPVTILLRPQGNSVDTDCSQFGGEE
jgi:hypothetical protein